MKIIFRDKKHGHMVRKKYSGQEYLEDSLEEKLSLTLDDNLGGTCFNMKDDLGRNYYITGRYLSKAIEKSTMINGRITGYWEVVNQGGYFGLKFLGEEND